jgi:hypothetical protein
MPLEYIRSASGEFECPNCGVTKRLQSTMHYHMKRCIGTEENVCTICNSQFYSKQGLHIHMQMRHGDVKAHVQEKVQQESSLTPVSLHTCPFPNCKFKPNTKGNRRVHCMRIHFSTIADQFITRLDHGDYHCTLCSNDFSSSTHFYYHIMECIKESSEKTLLDLSDDHFTKFMEIC